MNTLDAAGRQLVWATLDKERSAGRAIVMVEHDLSLVSKADRWLILELGEIAALDTPAVLLRKPERLRGWGIWL